MSTHVDPQPPNFATAAEKSTAAEKNVAGHNLAVKNNLTASG